MSHLCLPGGWATPGRLAAGVVAFSGRWPERNRVMDTIRVNMAAGDVSCSGRWPERNPTMGTGRLAAGAVSCSGRWSERNPTFSQFCGHSRCDLPASCQLADGPE